MVIKIGSSVLTDANGRLAQRTINRIASDIAPLASTGRWPYIVSSGAIAVGMDVLDLKARPRTIPGLQAAAAVGQSKLVEAWGAAFRKFNIPVGQVLLTSDDLADRTRFLNARAALSELQKRKAIAIINENDSVSFEEIAVGDNDGLAAQVSNLVDARVLILLSVTDGILDAEGERIPNAHAASPHLDRLVRPGRSSFGKGGMASKIAAARVAAARGAYVAIIDGKQTKALTQLIAGEDLGTVLSPAANSEPLSSRAHWIVHSLKAKGELIIDEGAKRAITMGNKSLLPSGVLQIHGRFKAGEAVEIQFENECIARGLARYDAAQIRRIAGVNSREISAKLGFTLGAEIVHKDDLVLLNKSPTSEVGVIGLASQS
jgi:glutamate 5-kinase